MFGQARWLTGTYDVRIATSCQRCAYETHALHVKLLCIPSYTLATSNLPAAFLLSVQRSSAVIILHTPERPLPSSRLRASSSHKASQTSTYPCVTLEYTYQRSAPQRSVKFTRAHQPSGCSQLLRKMHSSLSLVVVTSLVACFASKSTVVADASSRDQLPGEICSGVTILGFLTYHSWGRCTILDLLCGHGASNDWLSVNYSQLF